MQKSVTLRLIVELYVHTQDVQSLFTGQNKFCCLFRLARVRQVDV